MFYNSILRYPATCNHVRLQKTTALMRIHGIIEVQERQRARLFRAVQVLKSRLARLKHRDLMPRPELGISTKPHLMLNSTVVYRVMRWTVLGPLLHVCKTAEEARAASLLARAIGVHACRRQIPQKANAKIAGFERSLPDICKTSTERWFEFRFVRFGFLVSTILPPLTGADVRYGIPV